MGYGFIPQLLFYFLLMKRRHHGEKRIWDADTLPVCHSSAGSTQRLWESIIISAISSGKFSESRMILIFHLCNLWGKTCVFLSLVLLFGPTAFTCRHGACYTALLIPFWSASVTVLCILHHLPSESRATPHFFLVCKVWCMPIFRALQGSWEQTVLPAHLKAKSHIQLNSACVSYF